MKKILPFLISALLLCSVACSKGGADSSISDAPAESATQSSPDGTLDSTIDSGNDSTDVNTDTPVSPPAHVHSAEADDGNCTTAVKCACGEEMTAALTHSYDHDCDNTCNNAGCTATRAVSGHKDDGDGKCDACGADMPQTGDDIELPEDKFE